MTQHIEQYDLIDKPLEAERYELHAQRAEAAKAAEAAAINWDLDRRNFFRIAGGGVVVALVFNRALAQESGSSGRRAGGGGGRVPQEIGAWLHIGEDSKITVYTGKVEVGQNIRTSLTQVVAEELSTPVSQIKLVMSDTQLTPYDGGTVGSRTTPAMAPQLRRVAAAAREALLDLAAEQGGLNRQALSLQGGKVVDKQSDKSFEFGQLTKGQKLMKTVGSDVTTTPAAEWKITGTSVAKVDGAEFVTGRHKFTSDMHRPGMLFGKVLRPPSYKAIMASVDLTAAEAISGAVVCRDGDFIGVAAPDELSAQRALSAIRAEWKSTPQPSSAELFAHLKQHAQAGGGGGGGRRGGSGPVGSMEEGLRTADEKLSSTYTIAYIAHAPLEPRAAVAEWTDGKLTVWTGTQRPFGVREELARNLNIDAEIVRVIVPDTGSGYGGKHRVEAATEAARMAKIAGKPVKIVWTREEEFIWAYFRPAGVIEITSGVHRDGMLTAWECHNYNSGGSSLETPYEVPNRRSEFHQTDSPLQQGSYRALAATANTFARESHMDDLARAVKMDPLEFRLKNLKHERLRAVLEAAAAQFGWATAKSGSGRGVGLALGTEKGSYVATCAEIAIDAETDQMRITRVVTAFECGAVLNPDHLKSQIEGSIVQGLGGALFEAIQFADGKITNPRFSRYRVPRFTDLPNAMEIVLVNRKDLPSVGAGETPIVAIAPAIGNAICAATGLRARSLPMIPSGIKALGKENAQA